MSVNQYVLGPTIVELDRQIRIHDPLLAAAEAMGWATAIHHGRQLLGSLSVVMSRTMPKPNPKSIL